MWKSIAPQMAGKANPPMLDRKEASPTTVKRIARWPSTTQIAPTVAMKSVSGTARDASP
jgi:hypothetical protein